MNYTHEYTYEDEQYLKSQWYYTGRVSNFARFLQVVDIVAIIVSCICALIYFSYHQSFICVLGVGAVAFYISKSTFFFNEAFCYTLAVVLKIVIAVFLYYVVYALLGSRAVTDIGVSLFLVSRAASKRHNPFYQEPVKQNNFNAFDFMTGYYCGKGW